MNKFIICGRCANDPEVRYSQGEKQTAIVNFNFAVNRRFKRENEPEADFFSCVAFGKTAETFEKCNVSKGTKLLIEGEVRNNNYTDKDGVKHYAMQVVVSSFEFCESKASQAQNNSNEGNAYVPPAPQASSDDGFMNIPECLEEELPFS